MDVRFTEEQQALRTSLRRLLEDHSPIDHVRRVGEGTSDVDEALYARLLSLGVGDLPGLVELGIVMEECGRMLAPTPVLMVFGQSLPALDMAAADDLAAQVRNGDCIPIAVLDEWVELSTAGTATTTLPAVLHAKTASHLLIPVRSHLGVTGLGVVEMGDVAVEERETMDRTRRLSRVHLEKAPVRVVGQGAFDDDARDVVRRWTMTCVAHELIGVMSAVQDRAVDHAKTREQFGRPIGYYQAVSHRCADMFIAGEQARSLWYYAAWAVDAGTEDAAVAATQAKVAAGAAAVAAAQSSIQVHGGIGFTWEHDLHLFLKRAWWGAAALGPADALLLEVGDAALASR